MADSNVNFDDIFRSLKHSARHKDSAMLEIMLRRKEFEENLDKMWQTYRSGYLHQVVEYKKQVQNIKDAGLVVLRSKTTGKHKIAFPDDK